MTHDCARPGFGDNRRAEQLFLALDLAHYEIAGLQPPIDVPLGRLIAGVEEQRAFRLAPGDGKLVLLGEVADAAEVEYHDRLQGMLPRRAECAVIHHLHQCKKSRHRRDEQYRSALPGRLRRPSDVSGEDGSCDQRVRTQQNAQRAEHKRQHLYHNAKARAASAVANTIAAASNQVVANSTSRQMIPTKTKAGGVSASSGSRAPTGSSGAPWRKPAGQSRASKRSRSAGTCCPARARLGRSRPTARS